MVSSKIIYDWHIHKPKTWPEIKWQFLSIIKLSRGFGHNNITWAISADINKQFIAENNMKFEIFMRFLAMIAHDNSAMFEPCLSQVSIEHHLSIGPVLAEKWTWTSHGYQSVWELESDRKANLSYLTKHNSPHNLSRYPI